MKTHTSTESKAQSKMSIFRIVIPVVVLLVAIAAVVILTTNFRVITVSGTGESYTLESNTTQLGILYVKDGASAILRPKSHWFGPIISEEGTIDVQDNATITGPIALFSNGLLLGKNATVDGNLVLCAGSLTLQPGATVRHNVTLFAGSAFLEKSASIYGDVISFTGSVFLKEKANVHGDVILFTGSMQVGPEAFAVGKLISFVGGLDLASKAVLNNDAVVFLGDANLSSGSQVHGDVILTDGNAILENQSTILGKLYLNPTSKSRNGNVYISPDAQITRGVTKPKNIVTIAAWSIAGDMLRLIAPLWVIPLLIVCLSMSFMFYLGRRSRSSKEGPRKANLSEAAAQPMVPGSARSQ